MCIFSQYKDIFGKPNTALHAYRLYNLAIVDFILAIVLAILISTFTNVPIIVSIVSVLVFGELCHWLFCVDTNTIKWFKK